MKRRWINNCLTNQKGRRKQNGFFREYFSCNNKGVVQQSRRRKGGQWQEGETEPHGRREVRAWVSAELSMAAERRVSLLQQPQATEPEREESSGVLDLCKEDDKELGCVSPEHSCLLGCLGRGEAGWGGAAVQPSGLRGDPQARSTSGMGARMAACSHISM